MSESTALPPLPVPSLVASSSVQAALDESHLRLLEIGFYISAVLTLFRFLWFLLIGAFFAFGAIAAAIQSNHGEQTRQPPVLFFLVAAVILGVVLFLTLIFGVFEFYAGQCLRKREHPVLIQIVAALYCLSIPWGTALGVATFLVLNRPSVKRLFAGR